MVLGVEWGVLVDSIAVQDGDVVGALVVARHGRTWSGRERSLTKAFGSLLSHVATLATREGLLLHQRRLDELVAQVAEKLMSASATNRQEVLDWVCQVLAEFLNADVAFIRRNDLARGLTILESEWPPRDEIPDPDPLGEIPFDADPIFMALRDLRAPYLTGTEDMNDDYRERTMEGAGVTPAAGARRAALARRLDVGRPRLPSLQPPQLEPARDQRPPGGRLDARATPGSNRRRRAHALQREPR